MSSRDYFIVGCKVVGVYCISTTFHYFLIAVKLLLPPGHITPASSPWPNVVIYISMVIIYLLLGFYLLMNGTFVHKLAYPTNPIDDDNTSNDNMDGLDLNIPPIKDKLILGIHFAGIYLIIRNIPDAVFLGTMFIRYATRSLSPNTLSFLDLVPSL